MLFKKYTSSKKVDKKFAIFRNFKIMIKCKLLQRIFENILLCDFETKIGYTSNFLNILRDRN